MMRPERRRRIIVVVCVAIALIVAGVGYVLLAGGRVQDRIETRSAAAAAEVADFSADSAARLLPTPSGDSTSSDQIDEPAPADEVPSSSAPTPDDGSEPAPDGVAEDEPDLEAGPAVEESTLGPGATLFVNRVPGDEYGRLSIRNADGTRTTRQKRCERLHVAGGVLSCLESNETLLNTGILRVFTLDVADNASSVADRNIGLPSRTRVSEDGRFVTLTSFVTGHSYLETGAFATETLIVDLEDITNFAWNLEDYAVIGTDDPKQYSGPESNYWGVSFVPDSTEFYVTHGLGDSMSILRGDALTHEMWPVISDGSCPSVSPDGRSVVFKELIDASGSVTFQLVVVDIETGKRRILAETRHVNDQVEWLDNDTILYAIEREDSEAVQPTFDIWSLDLDGTGPELYLPFASSPAVHRSS